MHHVVNSSQIVINCQYPLELHSVFFYISKSTKNKLCLFKSNFKEEKYSHDRLIYPDQDRVTQSGKDPDGLMVTKNSPPIFYNKDLTL